MSELVAPDRFHLDETNFESLGRFIVHHGFKEREEVRKILMDPVFAPVYDLDMEKARELTGRRLKKLCQSGILKLADLKTNYLRYISFFEETAAATDGSLTTAQGVLFNLFGGSIVNLGTERHAWLVKEIETGQTMGCFGMTELTHGSNVQGIRTEARYDPQRREFVIETPCEEAQKYWLGLSAVHGKFCTVFAQLYMPKRKEAPANKKAGAEDMGDWECLGVHAFLVPIRNKDGTVCAGVRIADCGPKVGLHGVDNGRIWFDKVRVPQTALLNRFADVLPDGSYSTTKPTINQRFAATVGELVSGRVTICSGTMVTARVALLIAIRFAAQRLQFSSQKGGAEIPILDYTSVQLSLLRRLAQVYCMQIATNKLKEMYHNRSEESIKEVHVVSSAMKAMCSWYASDTVIECRDVCGGHGYSATNRFGTMIDDLQITKTYEGVNEVLLQQCAQAILRDFQDHFKGGAVPALVGTVTFLGKEAARAVRDRNPYSKRRTSEASLMDPLMWRHAFEYRERKLTVMLARALQHATKTQGMSFFDAWNANLHLVMDLSMSFAERFVLAQSIDAMEAAPSKIQSMLHVLTAIYALSKIKTNLGFFMTHRYFSPRKAVAIDNIIIHLVHSIRPFAVDLVDCFNYPEWMISAPLAGDYIHANYYEVSKNGPKPLGRD
eukprot:ANDGO_00617.mRNA.1 Acyl-coenzyme A oxidase